ncbi:hypothetical protein [Pediococcus pentosaceus]|uniref:Uncharacterized protein n=1 Tax=Pediococcus pentosaceus TaxID=1255 RepID=A0ABD7X961_PEDPE|nr:hypothetical protein [Pediococcus pentosaceus]WEA58283.1 hypothetical protein PWB86_09750 [Pediococcus pentosaceus]
MGLPIPLKFFSMSLKALLDLEFFLELIGLVTIVQASLTTFASFLALALTFLPCLLASNIEPSLDPIAPPATPPAIPPTGPSVEPRAPPIKEPAAEPTFLPRFLEFPVSAPIAAPPMALPKQKITEVDLKEDSYLGGILRDYQLMLDQIETKMRTMSKGYRMLSNHKHDVKDNMILAKNMLRGVWGENCNPKYPQPAKEYNFFDFTDENTVKELLSMNKSFDENISLWMAVNDFENVVKKAGLKDYEFALFKALKAGYTPKDIEDLTRLNIFTTYKIRLNIIKKVVAVGEHYDYADTDYKKIINLKREKQKLRGNLNGTRSIERNEEWI